MLRKKQLKFSCLKKLDALEDESLELCETVEKLLTESEEIATFERGKYLDNIRACCYELLSFNVGVKNIEKVIRSVLSNMTGKSISRLPSKTTLCDMMIESLTVAQAQLAEKLTETEEDYFTIHTNGTTKHGEHFGAFDVTTKDETYHLVGFDISFLALPRPPSTLFLKFLKILTPFAKQVVVKLFQTKFCVDSRTLCPIDMLLKNCFANFLLSIEKAFFLILFPIGTLCLQMNNAR